MTSKTPDSTASIRLVFELSRADNPRLFDELIRFHKGAKRVNRLRVLAYEGLLAQTGLLQSPIAAADASLDDRAGKADVSIGIFQASLDS